jgi:spermidine synthase
VIRFESSLSNTCSSVLHSEIFRDHGFIEDYPQLWIIPETQNTIPYQDENGVEHVLTMDGMDLVFRLEQNPDNALDIQVQWNFDQIEEHAYTAVELILLSRIRNLHRLKNIDFPLTAQDYNIPQDEWDAIWNFHQAYAMALKRAVIPIHDKIVAHGLSTMIQRPKDFGRSADSWDDHYTDFRVELDHIAYNDANCQSSEHTDFFSYQQYELEKSNYQEMEWQYRPKDDDTCLHLDGMLQICTSYRPHYHEFFVHYPARYLPEVKRVIFLGSGDAMLLHEILKYPSLEKVVGLELDQSVTRKSFKHFKTQPHYDDPRVEWWYGDATKTLPLLPRDYWGSFDLLLVDLSETVVSLHVTGKHDVLDVISMLLKPEGVMLENELYIDKMSRHFDHTVHIFYGSPKVCVQVHTVSSNSVDFLNSPIYDHGVDTFLIDKIEAPQDRFKFIHDYVKTNPIAEGKCNSNGVEELASMIEHGRPAGILMVLEAEQCTTPLDDKNLAVLIYDVLRKHGLTPLPGSSAEQDGTIHIVLREGYVVARMWPLLHYVGFDIHLWGAFAKMESVRNGLATALGANMTSSYRVVVGGMHSSITWEQDQASIGVQFSQKRNCTTPDRGALDLEPHTALRGALEESLSLLHVPRGLTVAVVCGSTDDCLTLTLLHDHKDVDNVIPFFSCHGVPEFNNGTKDFQPMYDCEREILERLTTLYNQEGLRIDAFVMDLTAPLSMLQIFASIWEDFDHRSQWLAERYVLAMPFTATETKRIRFMDLYRKLGHATVTSMAEFILQGKVGQSYHYSYYLGKIFYTSDAQNRGKEIKQKT